MGSLKRATSLAMLEAVQAELAACVERRSADIVEYRAAAQPPSAGGAEIMLYANEVCLLDFKVHPHAWCIWTLLFGVDGPLMHQLPQSAYKNFWKCFVSTCKRGKW